MSAVVAQSDPAAVGKEAYTFVMNDGETLYVLVDPQEFEKTFSPFLSVSLNEPWLSLDEREQRIRRSDIQDPYPELSSTQARRIAEGWAAAGGVEVETPTGKKWVHEEEYELAQRAQSLAKSAYAEERPVRAQSAIAPLEASSPSPDFFMRWGLHILIIMVTIALSAVVGWATMVRTPWRGIRS